MPKVLRVGPGFVGPLTQSFPFHSHVSLRMPVGLPPPYNTTVPAAWLALIRCSARRGGIVAGASAVQFVPFHAQVSLQKFGVVSRLLPPNRIICPVAAWNAIAALMRGCGAIDGVS